MLLPMHMGQQISWARVCKLMRRLLVTLQALPADMLCLVQYSNASDSRLVLQALNLGALRSRKWLC